MKTSNIQKLHFKIIFLSKWHPNINKIVHHNVRTTKEAYIGLDHHIRLKVGVEISWTEIGFAKSKLGL